MHYELYVDSLFLINLCMNLYLLMLVDHSMPGTAMPWRLLAGAAAGAVCYLLPFFGSAPAWVKIAFGGLAGTAGMICITFPVRNFRMFLKLLERLLLYSFGIGGGMLFLIARLPFLREYLTGVSGALCVGGVLFLFFRRFHDGLKMRHCLCHAALIRGERCMRAAALIDSGNGLTEPISGKPVCVVEKKLYDGLWGDEESGFRAIPYHSIGKRHGVMQGYLLPELVLDVGGMRLEFQDVYVAVSREQISGTEADGGETIEMIINPRLLEETGRGRPRGGKRESKQQQNRDKKAGKEEIKNDIQSGDARENTI